ncbi:MAG TPA: LD-carboxypeptidase [Desulfatiglandales bacterium]|nr:LD-carboxypeptidase [Desulfatiglandales bacterium]
MDSLTAIRAPRLKANQLVGIIAPASPISKSEIRKGIQLIESFPLQVRLGTHLFDHSHYLAGSDQDRASDIHQMFSDPEIKAILCARGGYGSLRFLDKIDYGLIRKNPKVLVGFSDLTALLTAIYKHSGLITIHGPTVSDLLNGDNWQHLSRLITTSYKPRLSLKRGMVINGGTARGILLGGNLATLCSLIDTPFLPSFEGVILFLEEKGEQPYRLDRMLTQLLLSGRLDHLSALVIGQIQGCGDEQVVYGLLRERFSEMAVPVVTGLPVGHGVENISLPLGLPALLDTEGMVLEIEESAVS